MKTRLSAKRGFTLIELLVGVLVIAVLIVGVFSFLTWKKVNALNTWAVNQEVWLEDELYRWIKDNSFAKGPGSGGDPDPSKPPPPPGGLE